MDLFFVLSGFLITGILWESRSSSHYFRNFYARRTLRVFPIYYSTLFLLFVIVPILLPLCKGDSEFWGSIRNQIHDTQQSSRYWIWFATYSVDFLAAWKGGIFLSHFWSLAVEEHFYLLWPLLIHRLRHSTLIKVTCAFIFGSLILRCCLFKIVTPLALYTLTPCRMDGLAMGGLVALVLRTKDGISLLRSIARISLPVLFVLLAVLMGPLHDWRILNQTIGYTMLAGFFASLLILALSGPGLARAFSNDFLRFLGKYSYGLYVIHGFVFYYFSSFFALGNPARFSLLRNLTVDGRNPFDFAPLAAFWLDGIGFVVVALGVTFLGAFISWRLIEFPCMRLKRLFPYEKQHPSSGPELVLSLAEKSGAVPPGERSID